MLNEELFCLKCKTNKKDFPFREVFLAAAAGFEPATHGLTVHCSTS